jgi:hypothetical protein
MNKTQAEIDALNNEKAAFSAMLKKAGLSVQEFSAESNTPIDTVRGWGVSGKRFPGWYKSWLENYIELQACKSGNIDAKEIAELRRKLEEIYQLSKR